MTGNKKCLGTAQALSTGACTQPRVLFINTPFNVNQTGVGTVPYGQFSIASNIKDIASVKLLDTSIIDEEKVLEEIRGFDPHHVGITLYDQQLARTKKLIARIKKELPGLLVSVGGPLATLFPEVALYQSGADFVFAGEAERTFREFILLLGTEGDIRGNPGKTGRLELIEGLYFLDMQKKLFTQRTKPCLTPEELETLPLDPALVSHMIVDKSFPLFTARGCPFACVFCTKVHGDRYRALNARRVMQIFDSIVELCELGKLPPVVSIVFTDDDFACDRERVMEITRAIREGKYPFKYYIFQSNILSFMRHGRVDHELVSQFTGPPFWLIKLGTESFNEKELVRLGKPYRKIEGIRQLIKAFHEKGLPTFHYLILTNPWTGIEDFLDNLFNAAEINQQFGCRYDINPSIIPRPGSRILRDILEQHISCTWHVESVEGHREYDYPLNIKAAIADPVVSRVIEDFTRKKVMNPRLDQDNPYIYLALTRKWLRKELQSLRRVTGSGERLAYFEHVESLFRQRYGILCQNAEGARVARLR
jgi:anaerobic magnesium-protoporphyrin IX monomethyl ester cyclase